MELIDLTAEKASVWDYFTKIDDEKAKCKLCKLSKTTKNRSTSGLKYHLLNVHKLLEFGEKKVSKQEQNKPKISNYFIPSMPKMSKELTEKLDNAAAEAIIIDGRPFSDFEQRGMVNFLKLACPNYGGVSRKRAKCLISKKYEEKQKELKKDFADLKTMSITTDMWSSRNRNSFMVITGHFLFKGELKNTILGFVQFNEKHTAFNIQQKLTEKVKSSGFKGKLISVTTDNGANVKKAACEFLPLTFENVQWIPCLAHILHLVVCKSLGLWENATMEDDHGNDTIDPWGENLEGEASMRCIYSALKKLRQCLSLFSRSNKLTHILKQKLDGDAIPQIDCRTRWNSTFEMINIYLECHTAIVGVLFEEAPEHKGRCHIENEELKILRGLHHVLQPFHKSTKLISGSQYSSLCLGLVVLKALSEASSPGSDDDQLVSDIKKQLSDGITKYFYNSDGNLKTCFEIYRVASYLDTVCYSALTEDEKCLCEIELRKYLDSVEELSCVEPEQKSRKRAAIDNLLDSVGLELASNKRQTNEIELYKVLLTSEKNQEKSSAEFWNDNSRVLPKLASKAFELQHCPITSVPSESAFSISGNLISVRRNRLKGETIEELMFLRDKY